jgi:hypothetical protein
MAANYASQSSPFASLAQAYQHGQLLLVWANLPWPLAAHPPANRALALAQWAAQSGRLTPAPALAQLPALPSLSLDPSDRIERAFAAASLPLAVVTSRRAVPTQGRHNLLKLGGDLTSRRGVILSRAELADLTTQPDKAHLLAEARRSAQAGAVLLLGADPAHIDFQAWWAVLGPELGQPLFLAWGQPEAPWPAGFTPLAGSFATLAAALAAMPPPIDRSSSSLEEGFMSPQEKLLAIHQRRLQKLQEQQAAYGLNTPPEILIEIEDIEAQIRQLQAGIKPAASADPPITQPGSAIYNINIQHASGLAIGDGARVDQSGAAPAQPEPAQVAPGDPAAWNTGAIRDLLTAAFDDVSLTAVCFDNFPAVYQDFSAGLSKAQKIQLLLDYCRRFERFEALLALVKAENPGQYQRFAAQLRR